MAQRKSQLRGREGIAGWLFTAPMIIILGVFLFVPIIMALWVSMTNWTGNVDPFGGGPNATFVGARNYSALFLKDVLARSNFMQSLGNTFYYVLLVVPLQTATSLLLALIVNDRFLRGKSFFRTAFYFPSVTSSIAISTVFLFSSPTPAQSTGSSRSCTSTGLSGSATRAACCTCSSDFSAPTTRAGRRVRSSGARCGTGSPARRWPCASSSSLLSGPRPAPSC